MEALIKSQETREGVRFRVFKDEEFKFVTLPFNNYFYVKADVYEVNKDDFSRYFRNAVLKVDVVGQFVKIILSNNFMRTKIRDFWEDRGKTFEADIKANKRFMLDRKLTYNNQHVPYTFFDIETDDRKPLQKDDRGKVIPLDDARVLSFSATDYKGEQFCEALNEDTDEAERQLLTNIITYFSKYGLISGWNSERFDMPYIKGRCDKLGVQYLILDYVNHLDYMETYKKYERKSLTSYSLNNVSNVELKESKIEQDKGNGAIYNTWKNDRPQLLKYNLEDSNLIYKINKKLMFIEVAMHRANNAGCHIQNTHHNSDGMDFLIMREYKASNIIMPSKPTKGEIEQRKLQGHIGGGHTTCFETGLFPEAKVWDFKSMYPSVIRTWNISSETYVETLGWDSKPEIPNFIITPQDYEMGKAHPPRVYKSEEGVIPRVLRRVIEDRDKIKYTMGQYETTEPDKYRQMYLEQYALKTDGNSIYGILSHVHSRYYSWELGDSVTTCCRALIKECYQKLGEWGCKVLGGDTDSTFVVINNNTVEDLDSRFVQFFDEWVKQWNVKKHYIVFEYEKSFEPFFFVKKKNYAYKMNGKIVIKGMEAIKSDSTILGAQLQRDFIYSLMNNTYNEEEWQQTVNNIYNRVYDQSLTSAELTLVKALTKMPHEYEGYIIDKRTKQPKVKNDGTLQKKAIPAHVKMANRMIANGKDLYPGSKLPYIVIHDKPILAVSPEEFMLGNGKYEIKHKRYGMTEFEHDGTYSAKYYWTRIIKPLIKVAYAYYKKLPDWDWNMTQAQKNKLLGDTAEEDE